MILRNLDNINKHDIHMLQQLGFIYETQLSGDIEYTEDHSSNQLDVQRWLQGNVDAWERIGAATALQRKKIVISDWSYRRGGKTNLKLWKILINNGFDIYVWTGSLVKVSSKEELMHELRYAEPITRKELLSQISNQFSGDECFIIDCISAKEIDAFFEKRTNNRFWYDDVYYVGLDFIQDSNETMISLLRSIPHGSPIQFSSAAEYLFQNPKILKWMKNNFQRLSVQLDLVSSDHPVSRSCLKDLHFKKLRGRLDERTFDLLQDHPEIEELYLTLSYSSRMKFSDINLNHIKQIKKLEIEELEFRYADLRPEDLKTTLEQCTQLEELALLQIGIESFPQINSPLKNLKKLSIGRFEFPTKNFVNFLKQCPNVEFLRVCCLRYKEEFDDLLLENVKELHVIEHIELAYQLSLMKSCPNLKKLKFSCHYDMDSDDFAVIHFSYLEELTYIFNYKNVSTISCLFTLVKNSPSLKKLTLNYNYQSISLNQRIELDSLIKMRPDLLIEYTCKPLRSWNDLAIETRANKRSNKSYTKDNDGYAQRRKKFTQGGITDSETTTNTASKSKRKKSSTFALDNETKNTNSVLNSVNYFPNKYPNKSYPKVKDYRLGIYDDIVIGNTVYLIQSANNKSEDRNIITDGINISPGEMAKDYYYKHYTKSDRHFYGCMTIHAGASDWIKLPSLFAEETIIKLNANIPLKLGYNAEESLYYVKPEIRLLKDVYVDFIIECRNNLEFSQRHKRLGNFYIENKLKGLLPKLKNLRFNSDGILINNDDVNLIKSLSQAQRVWLLVTFFNGFGEGELDKEIGVNWECLNELIAKKIGCCRHRSIVFMALAKSLGIKARFVENDVHAFIEVKLDHETQWMRCDLGGYRSTIDVKPVSQETMSSTPDKGQPKLVKLKTDKPKEPESNLSKTKFTSTLPPSIENNAFIPDLTSYSANDFIKRILDDGFRLPEGERNVLIVLPQDQIEYFQAELTRAIQQRKANSYYLHSLRDASASSPMIDQEGHCVMIDSPLNTFIKQGKEDVFMTNWSDFKPSYVGYNSLIDKDRRFKDTSIPPEILVIGILDQSQYQKMREDFFSRFGIVRQCSEFNNKVVDAPALPENTDNDKFAVIDFYDSRWRSPSLGSIVIAGNQYQYVHGEIVKAIFNKKVGIILRNAPWHLIEFRLFINELMLKRCFIANGEMCYLPENFKIYSNNPGYCLNGDYTVSMQTVNTPVVADFVISLDNLESLFRNYVCDLNGYLNQTLGWLEANKGKTITLLVTENLEVGAWARIIQSAKRYNCQLNIKSAPEIVLPKEMKSSLDRDKENGKKKEYENNPSSFRARIIISNDLEITECNLINEDTIVISTSKHDDNINIIETLRPIEQNASTRWEIKAGTLTEMLLAGKTVVLKGQPSQKLLSRLQTLFLEQPYLIYNGQKIVPKGKLVLLTNVNIPTLSFVKPQKVEISEENCWASIRNKYIKYSSEVSLLEKAIIHFNTEMQLKGKSRQIKPSYIILQTMMNRLIRFPNSNPLNPYLRLNADNQTLEIAKSAWTKTKLDKTNKSDNIIEKRVQKIIAELERSPYVFVVGPSGAGKSTLIQEYLSQEYFKSHPGQLFVGINKLSDWIDNAGILFIDEANLKNDGAWDVLEGLFNTTRGVIKNGIFHPLTENHKIVFAGNYASFAGRHEHQFFNRHGQVISFKELPLEFLIEKVISNTITSALGTDKWTEMAAKIFAQFYYDINSTYAAEHPITPRNLQMMCLRFADFMRSHPTGSRSTSDAESLAYAAAYDECSVTLTKTQLNSLKAHLATNYYEKWKYTRFYRAISKSNMSFESSQFKLTKSRRNPLRILDASLKIRHITMQNPDLAKSGTRGLLFEGAPGIGKSQIIIEYLQAQGFVQANENNLHSTKNRYYYVTPTDPKKMEALLLKAFEEGAIVVIDEVNTLPLEHILNPLMSGVNLEGKPSKNPGFFVMATQNPSDFAGRLALSEAFMKRFQYIKLKNYSDDELCEIIRFMADEEHLSESELRKLLDDYQTACQYANTKQLVQKPTPRDLFSKARRMMSGSHSIVVETITSDSKEEKQDKEKEKMDDNMSSTVLFKAMQKRPLASNPLTLKSSSLPSKLSI